MLAGVMTKINTTLVEVLSFFTLGRWGTEGFSRLQDEASPDANSVIVGQLQEIPSPAMDVLDLYDKDLINKGTLIGGAFNGFDENIIAITALNILFYIMIYYALKKKDSI